MGAAHENDAVRKPRRDHRYLVWIVVVAVVVAGLWAAQGVMRRRPHSVNGAERLNLFLITLDTTRADYLGCFGRESADTPNIDKLARDGVLFTRCSSCAGITLPSHASIMTGLYPFVHGARRNGTTRLAETAQTLAETLGEAGYQTGAAVASFVLNKQFGVGQGFDVYHDVVANGSDNPFKAERRGDDIREDVLEQLRGVADRPFFLWAHFYDPHHPYESAYSADTDSREAYQDEIEYVDKQIGLLIAQLESMGVVDRTLIVVVADHGEGLGDHRELRHGNFVYETVLHVPLIFNCPSRVPAGRSIAAQVRTIDIAPTVLELLGLPAWDDVQGMSLYPLITDEEQDLGLTAYADTFENQIELKLSHLRSLAADGYKYIHAPRPELYALSSDPGENHNLADERPELVASLRQRLRQVIAEAPPPVAEDPQVSAVTLGAADRARLESLGYLGSQSAEDSRSELERFEPEGRNPRDFVDYIHKRSQASWYMGLRAFDKAEVLYRELIEVFPEVAKLRSDLADALQEQGRVEDALVIIEQAVELAPSDYYVRRSYGRILTGARMLEPAVDQYTIALDLLPTDTGTMQEIAVALAALGRYDEAQKHLDRGLELAPRDASLHLAVGLMRLAQNRLDEAEASFNRALELDPTFPQPRAALQLVDQARRP